MEVIAIDSDESDESSPPHKMMKLPPSPSFQAPRFSNLPSPSVVATSSFVGGHSIIPCLWELVGAKGSRNPLKKVDYDSIQIH